MAWSRPKLAIEELMAAALFSRMKDLPGRKMQHGV